MSRASVPEIRRFIIQNVPTHPRDIAGLTAGAFGLSRQAVNHHLRKLVSEGVIESTGNTRARRYELVAQTTVVRYDLREPLEEHVVWRERVSPLLEGLRENVLDICHYGFTEMVNNAIDHSEGERLVIDVVRSAVLVEIGVTDDGVGIFNKIQKAFHLSQESDAVLELMKGKVTTDPRRHTGEGIFFTSRMCDAFGILSGRTFFYHLMDDGESERDWVLERVSEVGGTNVQMAINTATPRTTDEVFERFAKPDEFSFSVTHVPVSLAKRGEENLISRSQARRLTRGFERFEEVILDFSDVKSIGQAFADEVFRVFQLDHPGITLRWVNTTPEVERMILRARAKLAET